MEDGTCSSSRGRCLVVDHNADNAAFTLTRIDTLRSKFRQLNVWARRGERAPHKPLLILLALGKIQTGAERLLLFADVVAPLTKLLMEFGPARSRHHPDYPFWRLQYDGIWEVPEHSGLRRRKSNIDPLKSELLRVHACGGFPKAIYETLKRRPEIVRGLAQEILAAHFPDSLHAAIANEVGLNLYGRERNPKRDPAFRAEVLAAWGHQCAFCGFSVRLDNTDLALEAAHIRWVQAGGSDGINNGLACCAVHHLAFDRGALSITDDLTILVSAHLHGHGQLEEQFVRLTRQPMRGLTRSDAKPNDEHLAWHRRQVFRAPARE